MKILMLSGKKGSGKSSIQDAVAAMAFCSLKWRVVKLNFADELYNIHNYTLNRMRECGKEIEPGFIDRDLLQMLGTEWGRTKHGENVWVDMLKNKVGKEKLMHTDLVIVGDCRFENEFKAFPNAIKVRLVCAEEVRKSRCKKWGNTNHPSETGLDAFDEAGMFDLYLYTDQKNVAECAQVILNGLEKL